MIEFNNVTLGYGKRIVLRELNFSIHVGDYFGLVGPNGSGKTTLLRAILGTHKPISGEVRFHNVGQAPIRFGYVPQRDAIDSILPYTVEEVVMMGRYKQIGLLRRPTPDDKEKVRHSLQHTNILNLASHPFRELSGGQKQRTLIARAIASEPDVLVLDEPTNGMDLSSRASILELIRTLHNTEKLTVILVSHLLDDVANYVKRIAIVEKNFFQVGAIDEVLTSQNLSALYSRNVDVVNFEGNLLIRTGGRDGK